MVYGYFRIKTEELEGYFKKSEYKGKLYNFLYILSNLDIRHKI